MRRGPAVAVVHVPRVSSYVGAQILCSGLQAHSGTLVVWYGLAVGMGLVWSGLVWYGVGGIFYVQSLALLRREELLGTFF